MNNDYLKHFGTIQEVKGGNDALNIENKSGPHSLYSASDLMPPSCTLQGTQLLLKSCVKCVWGHKVGEGHKN